MAPEQCLERPVSPATDVFALAVTLFEVLAGKLPFRLGSPRRPYPQTQDEPVPLHRYRPGIHSKLDHLLLAVFVTDAKERPPLSEVILTLHDPHWIGASHVARRLPTGNTLFGDCACNPFYGPC